LQGLDQLEISCVNVQALQFTRLEFNGLPRSKRSKH